MKFCETCEHVRPSSAYPDSVARWACGLAETEIRGRTMYVLCISERGFDGHCGPDGRYWTEKVIA